MATRVYFLSVHGGTDPHRGGGPSPWITRWARLIEPGGAVLDVACGDGRHARMLAERGHPVTGVDRDLDGVGDLRDDRRFRWIAADLEDGSWPLARERFAGVVVTNYLWRPLLPRLVGAVDAGGVLLYETFAVGNQRFGRPRRPEYLLRPGELLEAVAGELHVVAFEQGIESSAHGGARVVQRIAASRRSECTL